MSSSGLTKPWYVYILQCADETLYTGITTDLERRIAEHNGDNCKGARYTKSRQPVNLIYFDQQKDRATASIREAQIKKLTRAEKIALINTH